MKQNSKEKILNFLSENKDKQYKIQDFVTLCNVSRQAVSKALSDLVLESKIIKYGQSPKVFFQYFYSDSTEEDKIKNIQTLKNSNSLNADYATNKIIKDSFYSITPIGEKKLGEEAFYDFCKSNKRDVEKTKKEYTETLKSYEKFKINGFVNAKNKIEESLHVNQSQMYIDDAFYLDFYSYPVFGKTKLGAQVFYSKNSQDEKFMKEIFAEIKDKVLKFVKDNNIKSVSYIPPTIKRNVQFMNVLKKYLNINLPEIKLIKVKTDVTVQQKSIKKLSDRIQNAKHTILIDDAPNVLFENILLIDDAVGSGATFNEVAKKIKDNNISKKVYALALVGSANGFDVINEV